MQTANGLLVLQSIDLAKNVASSMSHEFLIIIITIITCLLSLHL